MSHFVPLTTTHHDEMADDEEYPQLTISEAFAYRVPPLTSAQGHK